MTQDQTAEKQVMPVAESVTETAPVTLEPANNQAASFADFNLPQKLQQALNRMQFAAPTPIQSASIPLVMAGRDILGSAQTGTGKTGAFCIPLIARLMEEDMYTALILTPTRELATQVLDTVNQLINVPDFTAALLIGGEPMGRQFAQLKQQPRIVVGTPGRVCDHLNRGSLDLEYARYLVLDETDRMLDLGLGQQIEAIAAELPEQRQTLMFSATLPSGIVRLANQYMNNPERIAVGSTTSPIAKISQQQIETNDAQKFDILMEQLEQREGTVIIFVKTRFGADKLADKLCRHDHAADAIHGDLQQRQRERVLQKFREQRIRILVATDVAARGLDIPHIAHVVNYDLPQCPEDYIHRIGRTGRAGAEGCALSLLTSADRGKWRAIQRLIGGSEASEQDNQRKGGKGGKSFGGKKSFGGGGKPFGKKPFGERKPFGDRGGDRDGNRNFNRDDRPQRGDRFESNDRPQRDRFESNDRPSRSFGERKPFGDRGGDRDGNRNFNRDDRPQRGDRPQYGDRPQRSDKPRFEDRGDRPQGDRPSRPFGERKPFGERDGNRNFNRDDRPQYGDRPQRDRFESNDRPQRSDKPRFEGRGDRPQGDRPARPFGEKKPFGKKPFGDKPAFGEKKSFGGGKPFGKKPFGEKKSFGGGKPFGKKPFGGKPNHAG